MALAMPKMGLLNGTLSDPSTRCELSAANPEQPDARELDENRSYRKLGRKVDSRRMRARHLPMSRQDRSESFSHLSMSVRCLQA